MLSPTQRPSKKEQVLVAIFATAVVVLTSLPSLLAAHQRPTGATYLGTNVPDTLDSQVYYAFIQANADGNSLYRNAFTSEPQPAVLFNPLWWTLGRLVALTGWSPVTIFWIAKAIVGILLILGLHRLLLYFFAAPRWRFVALLLAVFGSGLGGVFLLGTTGHTGLISIYQNPSVVSALPVDVTYAAGFVWFSLLHSPLYTFSIGMLLLIGWAIWRSLEKKIWIQAAGIATLILGFVHPYDLFIIFGVVIATILLGIIGDLAKPAEVKKIFQRMIVLLFWALPAVVYYAVITTLVPVIHDWNQQNILQTSNLRTVIAGFAPMIFFIVVGTQAWWRDRRKTLWVPLAWATMAISLMYFPLIQYQAKMIVGLSIPIAVLATAGLQKIWERRGKYFVWRRAACVLVIAVSVSTPGIFISKTLQSQKSESRYFYMDQSLARAFTWIRDTTPTNSIILGDIYTGNLVPQYARRTTYLGHHHQTGHFQTKLAKVRKWFYHDAEHGAEKAEWLRKEGIHYVVFGPYERLQGSFDPASVPGLTPVFTDGSVTVFRFNPALGD